MKKSLMLIALFTVCITLLVSCAENNVGDLQPTTKSIEEIGGLTPTPYEEKPSKKYVYNVSEVEPVNKPISESVVNYNNPDSIDEFFSELTCAVRCKVTRIREYMYCGAYENTDKIEEKGYFSILSVKVYDVYGDAKLNYRSEDTINVMYIQSTHEDYTEFEHLAVDDNCILFIVDGAVNRKEYTADVDSLIDYQIILPEFSVCKRINNKYLAKNFMSLVGKNGDSFTKEEIMEAITNNMEKFESKSELEVFREKYLPNGIPKS